MKDESAFHQVVKNINSNKEMPAMDIVKDNPYLAAIISKLNASNNPAEKDKVRNIERYGVINQSAEEISDNIKRKIKDNENIKQLFPDIEICKQILVSVISSSKDMMKTELNYSNKSEAMPTDISMALNEIISNHMDTHYDVKEEISNILKECLFETGSYIKAVIPESTLDDIINNNQVVSTESFSEKAVANESIGILGPSTEQNHRSRTIAIESFLKNRTIYTDNHINFGIANEDMDRSEFFRRLRANVEVSDNYNLLKLPIVFDKLTSQKIKSKLSFSTSLEHIPAKNLTEADLSNLLYKSNNREQKSALIVAKPENSSRRNVGRPLNMKIPSEACIPVHKPYDPSYHVGYFILIDGDGYPVTIEQDRMSDQINGLSYNKDQDRSVMELITQKARTNIIGYGKEPVMDDIASLYAAIVEKDLLNRLKNGIYGTELAISNDTEIYNIMFARALANRFTRIVYLPIEIVTYFAFDSHPNGTGKSLLDDAKILTSIRATLLFAKLMAQIRSSIATTEVEIQLDPEDPDPEKTAEMVTNEVAKLRQAYFPVGINSAVDIVDFLQRAGLMFKFKNHPAFPDMELNFSSTNIDHQVPDDDLDELLRKQTYMLFSLSPDMVESSFNAEFATTAVINNQLFNRRIVQYQNKFSQMFSSYVQKIVSSDAVIYNELLKVIESNEGSFKENLDDKESEQFTQNKELVIRTLLNKWIEGLVITLPAPDTVTIESQAEAFDKYMESLEKALDIYIPDSLAPSDISDKFEGLKSNIKTIFALRWMNENGFMTELSDLVTKDDSGKSTINVYDELKNHVSALITAGINSLVKMQPLYNAAIKDIEEQNIDETEGGSSDYSSSSDSDSDSDSGGGDDFGMGDFDMGDMGGGDEGGDESGGEEEGNEEKPSES